MSDLLALCFSRSVVRRAVFSSVIVGSLLILINHFEAIIYYQIDSLRLFQIALTMIIPYVVSTMSSVITIQELNEND